MGSAPLPNKPGGHLHYHMAGQWLALSWWQRASRMPWGAVLSLACGTSRWSSARATSATRIASEHSSEKFGSAPVRFL